MRALLVLPFFALAACSVADDARTARTANRMLFDRQDPRFCADAGHGCPERVPGHLQQRAARCALDRVRAAWATTAPTLPTTTYTFDAALNAMDIRQHTRAGGQRKPADNPADEDAAAARMTALFDQAIPPCVANLRAQDG